MAERDVIASGLKIKQKHIFNLDELYKSLYQWFETYGYDFQELEYRDSVESGGKHIEIRWHAEKKIDDYIKYVIRVSFIVLGMEKIEIEREGVKEKTNKGDTELRFDAWLEKDYEDNWSKNAVMKFLREAYDKYVIINRLDSLSDELYEELYKLMDEVKAFLNLHRFQ